jgi:pimeloyl-ACP methyl ester carboxylesterase
LGVLAPKSMSVHREEAYSGKTIDVPALYIGGPQEWAVYQSPGSFERMHSVCMRLKGVHLVDQAGHSVIEEQPDTVNRLLIEFLAGRPA